MKSGLIKVMIVDDSSVFRLFLTWVLNTDQAIEVVGAVHDGFEAVKLAPVIKPDLITIDLNMPGMSGYETTRQIMEVYPVPIIIVSGLFQTSEADMTFSALKAGALTILPKPYGIGHPDHKDSVYNFLKMVKTLAEVKVIRRIPNHTKIRSRISVPNLQDNPINIIAIGSSAGGPPVLQEILSGLNPEFKIPIIIVQHVDPGFAINLCSWLHDTTKRNVVIANDRETIKPATIYMAPADSHITTNDTGTIIINRDDPEHGCRPSVSYLFRGILKIHGKHSLGIILTGMGTDGAKELREMFVSGCHTIVQDPATSLVNGMPGEAIRLNAASDILSPAEIVKYLNFITNY
jgi:two-component system chemotaxis response regulator CheB